MTNTEITLVCNATNMLLEYNQYMDPTDNEAAMNLKLQSVKKYQRYKA